MRTKSRITTDSHLDSPRVRFNWGFWDAIADKTRIKSPRFDGLDETNIVGRHPNPHYANGYVAGAEAAKRGEIPSLSDNAWFSYIKDRPEAA